MTFQPGDYIKCNLDDQYLTVGKIYQVIKISESAEMVEITSDIGMNYFYPIVCFCPANKTMQFLPDDFPANKFDEMVKKSPYYKEKPEFKVDKLGYYRTRDGRIMEVIFIYSRDFDCGKRAMALTENDICMGYSLIGKLHNDEDDEWDLIEYIGTELPKEPVTFESVIEVINVSDTHLEVIGSFDDFGIKEGVKYKIIMQEIIE